MGSLNDLIVHGRQDNVRAPPPRGKKKKSPQGSTNFYWTPDGAFGTGLG